jgi:hypothetical protein
MTLSAFRPRLARPLDSFDWLMLISVAAPVIVNQFYSAFVPDVLVSLYPLDPAHGDLLQPWWPQLSAVRITVLLYSTTPRGIRSLLFTVDYSRIRFDSPFTSFSSLSTLHVLRR